MTADIELSAEAMRRMIRGSPDAFGEPYCGDCGRPMIGAEVDDGPYCLFC